jgi:ubiquinone/menaquinone biosynthesis C-methylase UbiE
MAEPTTPAVASERAYLPPMAKQWLLPLYDPMTRLFGVRRIHARLLEQAALRPGQQVLEIGCGTGNLLLQAKAGQPDAAVAGLDPDLAALARARRKARRRGLAVRLDHGFADELPYPDGSVDVVLSAFMLHHVPDAEKEPAVREVLRVLRPGGALHLLDIEGHAGPHNRHATHHAQESDLSPGHPGDDIPDLLRRAGFADVAETGTLVRRRIGRVVFHRAARAGTADG